jgi:hypothetical protein
MGMQFNNFQGLTRKGANLTSCYEMTEVAFFRLGEHVLAGVPTAATICILLSRSCWLMLELWLGCGARLAGWLDLGSTLLIMIMTFHVIQLGYSIEGMQKALFPVSKLYFGNTALCCSSSRHVAVCAVAVSIDKNLGKPCYIAISFPDTTDRHCLPTLDQLSTSTTAGTTRA